eukprot:2639121-Karenia_brevis.AAC.1
MTTNVIRSEFFGVDGDVDWSRVTVQQLVDHEIKEYGKVKGGECDISSGIGIYAQNCESIDNDIPNILEKFVDHIMGENANHFIILYNTFFFRKMDQDKRRWFVNRVFRRQADRRNAPSHHLFDERSIVILCKAPIYCPEMK